MAMHVHGGLMQAMDGSIARLALHFHRYLSTLKIFDPILFAISAKAH